MVKCLKSFIFAAIISYSSLSAGVLFVKFSTPQELPTTVAGLAGTQFVSVGRDSSLNVDLYSYPQDPHFLLCFDTHGNIAGVRACYVKSDIPKTAESNGKVFPSQFFQQTGFVSENYWNTDLHCITVLFTSPETLKSGGRSDTNGLLVEHIYMNTTGTYTEIGTDECAAEGLGFRKQGCYNGMGVHYFYNMDLTTDCSLINPHFMLFEKGVMVGVGLIAYGYFTSTNNQVWFQGLPIDIVKALTPYGPTCIGQYITDYGGSSLHLFFKNQPNLISCNSTSQCS